MQAKDLSRSYAKYVPHKTDSALTPLSGRFICQISQKSVEKYGTVRVEIRF